MGILVLVFKKIESGDKTKYEPFYSNSKPEIVINESDIDNEFQSINTTIILSLYYWFSHWSYYYYFKESQKIMTILLKILNLKSLNF